jgi:hypothetical protein
MLSGVRGELTGKGIGEEADIIFFGKVNSDKTTRW